jgi:general secretion pathway protein I
LSRSTRPPNRGSRGFTLVEALIALTVLMILLAAIGGLSASSLRAGFYVEHHVADIEAAQQMLAGLPARNELVNRTLTGDIAGYRWRMDAQPFTGDPVDPRAQTRWVPDTIVLTMKGPTSAPMSFETIRLVRTNVK